MKLLHICSIDNDKANGVSVIVPKYAEYQAKAHKISLYNVNKIHVGEIKNVEMHCQDENIEDMLDACDYDIAVFHGIYFLQYLSIYKKLMKRKIPYVIVPHGSLRAEAQTQKKLPKMILNVLFYNRFIRKAAALQYLSEIEKEASATFKNKNIVIIPSGVEVPHTEWKMHDRDEFVFVFIGRYSIFHKGLDLLIHACGDIQDELRKRKISVQLYGVDFERNLQEMKKMVKEQGVGDIVLINGPLYDDKKIQKLLEADCFIQTSRSEGQPVGILEAMSLGMVTVVTEGTTFSSIVKNENCGFDAGNAETEIKKAIIEAYEQREDFETMSKNARKLIIDQYSWEVIVKKTIGYYKKLLGKNVK